MSREILFRIRDGGHWYYGLPLKISETNVQFEGVDENGKHVYSLLNEKDTLGQFIEHHDVNGTRIFDGDIIQYRPRNCNGEYIYKDFRRAMVVAYEKGVPQYRFLDKFDRLWKDSTKEDDKDEKQENNQSREFGDYTEVIGNIYDGILESKLKGVWFKEGK